MAVKKRNVICFCAALLLANEIRGQAPTGLAAVRVTSGLSVPVFVTAPPADSNRVFIVQQGGQIRILKLDTGLLNATPFLTVTGLAFGGEQGLLGLAFDPDYASNGKFYVNYTAPGGAFGAGVTRIEQYQVSSNPDIADTNPETIRTLLTFDQSDANHNGGWIGFSPRAGDDHNLYIATGDGGAGNDQGSGHIEPGGNAQSKITLLGKMLRIHVDPDAGTYSIPPNNPFFGSMSMLQEIWAFGLRNPFRASFDRQNGRMFIGDVGQSAREEIDAQEASNPGGGENYGWRLREGTIATPGGSPPVGGSPPPGNVDPILDYPRTTGGTVIGGYVYRGSKILGLVGTYVFGDYLNSKIFRLEYNGSVASNFQTITPQLFPIPLLGGGTVNLANPSSFGEDASGEIYITDISNGNIYKLVPALASVVSRKIHGSAGTFDLDLPLTGAPGVESRSGGAGGNHMFVFSFSNPLGSIAEASVSGGTGSVTSRSINPSDTRQYFVNLTSVANAQMLTLTLTNVSDAASHNLGNFSITMNLLTGDVNANGAVNSSDVAATKLESGHAATAANFRADVNVNGAISASDIALVKSQLGTGFSFATSR